LRLNLGAPGGSVLSDPNIAAFQRQITNALHRHWKLYLFEGILLLVLGTIAIIVPPLATLAVTAVLGWLFLISGAMGLFTSFMLRQAPGFWWSLLSAVIGLAAGLLLLAWPVSGALSLTLLLVAFFLIEGIASIMFALDHKHELTGQWGWMLFSGVVDVVLAFVIFTGLPGTAGWALGLLVGINMIFGGWALVLLSLAARKAVGG
jgi:uncharacterized membrane protein HdeD (DUF308 family)